MFLLLGVPDDPCLAAVAGALAARSRDARIIGHPFMDPASTAWRFDSTKSDTTMTIGGERVAVDGVLAARRAVPTIGLADQWAQEDLLYNHAEAEAALLGWLWGLRCPVIDRLPAWLWYRTRRPVLAWGPLLKQSRLLPLDSVITGAAEEVSRFLRRQGGGAIESLAFGSWRQLVDESDAAEISETARIAPVRLTELHLGAWRACMAGAQLVWDDGTPAEAGKVSSRLQAFAASAGLCCVEFVITSGETPRIVDIEHRPRFELFGASARDAIAEGLAAALIQGSRLPGNAEGPSRSWS
jgi:hypothetical protein